LENKKIVNLFKKTNISIGIRGSINQHNKVNDLLKVINEQFATFDKFLVNTLIMQFSSMKLKVFILQEEETHDERLSKV